jgi:hypothetical protein
MRHRMVEITASDEEIIARLRSREASRQEVSDARLEDFEMLCARSDPLDPNEAHFRIASQSKAEATTTDLLKAMVASSPAWPEPQPCRGIKEKM